MPKLLVAVLVATTAFTACGEDDERIVVAQPTTSAPPNVPAAPSPIIMKDFTFVVPELKAGTKLQVQNEGPAPHTLTAEDNSFDTGRIAAGDKFEFTLPSVPGTYKVKCTIHPSRMTAELKVT